MDIPATGLIGMNGDSVQEKIAFNGRVMRFSPTPDVVYRQVLLLAIAGRDAEAAVLLERAMRLYPEQVEGFLQTARALPEPEVGAVPAAVRSAQEKLAQIRSANRGRGRR
jgi:hypothetical protein